MQQYFSTLLMFFSSLFGGGEVPQEAPLQFGAFGDPFISLQLATGPDNGECLSTDGTNNIWGSCAAGGGEANTGATLGTGLNLFDSKSGVTLRFNSLAAGSNITLSTTTNNNTIVINSTGGGSGFSTTSADYWKSVNNFFSTTSADYWKTQNNFFSTTSANFWASLGLAFSTTSANYWETQQTARTADDLTDNQIDDLSDVSALSETLGDLLSWNGSSWIDIATSTLGIHWNDLRGIPAGFADGVDDTGGGSGNVSTSTNETAGRLSYWTSTAGTPALLGEVATTTLTASSPLSLSQAVVKVGGSNSVLTLDTSGTWTGNAGTASALAANGTNASAGNAILGVDASGNAEGAFDVWTEAENTAANYEQALTAGDGLTRTVDDFDCDTASGSIFGCLSSANWTLFNNKVSTTSIDTIGEVETLWGVTNILIENDIDASSELSAIMDDETGGGGALVFAAGPTLTGLTTLANASSTLFSTGYASSTIWRGGGLVTDCDSDAQTLGWDLTTGQFTCGDDDSGIGGGITTIKENDGDVVTGATAIDFGTGFDVAAVVTEGNVSLDLVEYNGAASTTLLTASYASSTLFHGAGLSACGANSWLSWASGVFGCTNLTTSGDWTGTLDGFEGADLDSTALGSEVTGTLPIANGGTGSTTAPVSQLLYGGATAYQSVATSSATCTGASGVSCTTFSIVGAGGTTIALSSIPNSSLANSTISGISLGSNLANLTATDSTLTFSGTYTGATARTIGLNLGNANTWTALQTFANASSSLLSTSYASSTLYYGAGLANCNTENMLTWTDGRFGCEADTSGGGGASDFTFTSNFGALNAATSSPLWAQGGINASSTINIHKDVQTNFFAERLSGTQQDNGRLLFDYNGEDPRFNFLIDEGGLTSALSFTAFEVLVPNNLNAVELTAPLLFGGYAETSNINIRSTNGAGTTDYIKFSVGNAGATEAGRITTNGRWGFGTTSPYAKLSVVGETVASHFTATTTATSTFPNALITNATSTTLNVSGQVDFDTLTSALVLAGSTGVLAEYAGASCTNQVVTALTAAGGATCTTINGNYLDLTANYAWTGAHDFGGGVIEITNGASPTVDAIGEIALDTTANELLIATSTTAAAPGVMKVWQPIRFSYASSTQGSGTTTRSLGVAPAAGYLDEIQCDFSNFMRVMIYDGTNRLNDLVASSTIGTVKFTANNSFTSGEAMRIDIGTTTNIAANVYGGCTAKFYYTRN